MAIDRCNFDQEQRAHWLRLHPPQGTRVAVFLDVPASVAYDRVLARPAALGVRVRAALGSGLGRR